MVGEMSSPWRERTKRAVPAIVHGARLFRLLRNQLRFPIASTMLDYHGTILAGPFAGMRFPRSGIDSYCEVLGTYEQCLIPIVEEIIRRPPPLIIDVGASYGYYALGFARSCPNSRVIAYEMDRTRAALLRKYRDLNGLNGNPEIRARCSTDDLHSDLSGGRESLLFMDVEGAEDTLLAPDKVPGLARTEIIVELHDIFVPGTSSRIRQRFAGTHDQTLIEETPPRMVLPTEYEDVVRPYWRRMTSENRVAKITWMHLVPKRASA
jgi:hypothetical protein